MKIFTHIPYNRWDKYRKRKVPCTVSVRFTERNPCWGNYPPSPWVPNVSASLQVCRSASLQVCGLQVCGLQVCSLRLSHTGSRACFSEVPIITGPRTLFFLVCIQDWAFNGFVSYPIVTPVCKTKWTEQGLEPGLPFFRFWFSNMASGPQSQRDFRETGPSGTFVH